MPRQAPPSELLASILPPAVIDTVYGSGAKPADSVVCPKVGLCDQSCAATAPVTAAAAIVAAKMVLMDMKSPCKK